MHPKSLHIVTVSGGSPVKNPPLILLCVNTTAEGMWSPLTLMAEVAVMFSLFSPDSFPSDILSLGSHILGRLFGTVERQLLSILKIPFGGNFNFWYNAVKFSKTSVESMLVSADIYATVNTDIHPTLLLCHSQHRHSPHIVMMPQSTQTFTPHCYYATFNTDIHPTLL